MLKSGSPFTTMMSASLPTSTVPRSADRPRIRALIRVVAEMARWGDIPRSTWDLISLHIASVWKFMGVPESVPMPMTAPASMNWPSEASPKNIWRGVVRKYRSV